MPFPLQDNRLHIYTLSGDTLTPEATYDHMGPVLDVKYSPDGALLATCDGTRRVSLYSVPDYTVSWGRRGGLISQYSPHSVSLSPSS